MKLLLVTDNGFYEKNGEFFCNAPNITHMKNLSPYFDQFEVVARKDFCVNGYSKVGKNVHVTLVEKKNIVKLKKAIKRVMNRCHAVICYGTNGYFASVIGKKAGKVVISYNGGDPYDFCMSRGTMKGRLLAPIARYMCRKSFANSDFGHYCDDFLFERYPASGEMLACSGVDIACDEKVLDARIKKIERFQAGGPVKLGLTGHTKNGLKGIDIAIHALKILGPAYSLEIAGRGDTAEYMELANRLGVEKQVRFLGVLSAGDELMSWLDSLDIYVQPSRIEGLPRATIEAMSRGCPCVTSDAGALSKLVNEKYVFTVKDPDLFTQRIFKISRSEEMIGQAKENFERSKKYERTVRDRKYHEFYSKVVDEVNKRSNLRHTL